jgi:hypothetical protein
MRDPLTAAAGRPAGPTEEVTMSLSTRPHVDPLFAATVLAALLAPACGRRAALEPDLQAAGSVSFSLTVAPGVTVNTVNYRISGNGIAPIAGSIDVRADGSAVSPVIGGLPDGSYIADLDATSSDGQTRCRGFDGFAVRTGITTFLTVLLDCQRASAGGAVSLNAKFNTCPVLGHYTISSATTAVGTPVTVTATATDPDGPGPLRFQWSTQDGGSFQDPIAPNTLFLCDQPGFKRLSLSVSDGRCASSATLSVNCVPAGRCGNGIIEPGETCEPPGTATCDHACQRRMPPIDPCDACVEANCTADGPGCDSLPSPIRRMLCQSLTQCMRRTRCGQMTNAFCWCGGTPIPQCATGMLPPSGPCRPEEEAAAESTEAAIISERFNDPAFASGAAHNRNTCEKEFCASECANR